MTSEEKIKQNKAEEDSRIHDEEAKCECKDGEGEAGDDVKSKPEKACKASSDKSNGKTEDASSTDDAEAGDDGSDKAETGSEEGEDEMTSKYVRLMAEFQNYKKRVSKEKDDLRSYANESLVTSLLEVIDNFERALEHESGDENYAAGMKMIFKQMMDKLEKAGLTEIEALGADFDPNFHNAVLTGDDAEYGSGKISMVMQKGYTLNGKVIRASMVKVNN